MLQKKLFNTVFVLAYQCFGYIGCGHSKKQCVGTWFEAVEEEECWRQYEAVHAGPARKTNAGAANAGFDGRGTKSPAKKRCSRQAHMDDVTELMPCVYGGRDGEPTQTSTFWMRRLDAAESADPDRYDIRLYMLHLDKQQTICCLQYYSLS